jgi:hypothetical protein
MNEMNPDTEGDIEKYFFQQGVPDSFQVLICRLPSRASTIRHFVLEQRCEDSSVAIDRHCSVP